MTTRGILLLATTIVAAVAGCAPTGPAPATPLSGSPSPAIATTAPTPAATATPTASVPAAAGGDVVYRAPGNLCPFVDVSALHRQVGRPDLKPMAHTERTSSGTIVGCTVRLGSRGNAGGIVAVGYVYNDNVARQSFYQLRQMDNDPTTPVPGVGTEAYTSVDGRTRPQVAAYDANLHLLIVYVPNQPLTNPRALLPALVQVCRATMNGLHRHSTTSTAGTRWRPT